MTIKHAKHTHIYKQSDLYALELDVYLPEEATSGLPVVVYMHGGALIWGSRESISENEVAAIIGEGMAYVSIDYRLAPETQLMEIRSDVEAALRWVREDGASYYGFDASRIAVLGRSAGGYLALLCGTLQNKPKAIVSFYGYGDIMGDWYTCPSPHYIKHPSVSPDQAAKCMTSDIPTHAGHADRWPLYLRARQTGQWPSLVSGYDPLTDGAALKPYCPIKNIDDQYPPTLLLHGTADTDVPVERSIDMHAALKTAGIQTQLYVLPDAEHGFDSAWQNTPEEHGRVIRFLQETLL